MIGVDLKVICETSAILFGMGGAERKGREPMLAKDIMTPNVITIAPSLGVEEIAQLLLSCNISGVPVVDAEDRLIGLVSEGDLAWPRTSKQPSPAPRHGFSSPAFNS